MTNNLGGEIMSTRTVYFFKMQMKIHGDNVPITHFKTEFDRLINTHSTHGSIVLTTLDVYDKIVMDINRTTNKYIFGTLGKQRPDNTIHKRDYNDLSTEGVLGPTESHKGIEIFTYFLVDFLAGILTIVKSQGTPNAFKFSDIFTRYTSDYTLDLTAIPNDNTYEKLLNSNDPKITQFLFRMPMSDGNYLEEILGISEEKGLLNLLNKDSVDIQVDLKINTRLTKLTKLEQAKEFLNLINEHKEKFKKARVFATTEDIHRSTEFDIFEELHKNQINVNLETREGGIRKMKPINELYEIYYTSMKEIYEENSRILKAKCDIIE